MDTRNVYTKFWWGNSCKTGTWNTEEVDNIKMDRGDRL